MRFSQIAKKKPCSNSVFANLAKFKMCHAIYEFGVLLSKDLHGDDDFFIRAFFQGLQCNLASSPLTSGDFAISPANIKGEHIIYAFGVIFCKEFNGEVVIVCCATYEIQVCTPNPEPCKSFACNNISFSASEIVAPSMLPVLFHVFFKSSSPNQPPPCCHMCEAGFQLLLHLSLCQLHRHYSVSGIIVLLSCYLNSCNALLFMS